MGDTGLAEYKKNVRSDVTLQLSLFVPFQLLNFSLVPPHFRVPALLVFGCVWIAALFTVAELSSKRLRNDRLFSTFLDIRLRQWFVYSRPLSLLSLQRAQQLIHIALQWQATCMELRAVFPKSESIRFPKAESIRRNRCIWQIRMYRFCLPIDTSNR